MVYASDFDDYFSVVFITAETEKHYDQLPLNRSILAEAVERIHQAGARGLILKFFVDLPKKEDPKLAQALSRTRAVLQARLDPNEANPNPLPQRFFYPQQVSSTLAANSGWIPVPALADVAYDIGFADYDGLKLSLFENYQNKTVKSLLLCALELALDQKSELQADGTLSITPLTLKLNASHQLELSLTSLPAIQSIAFETILQKQDWRHQVKGKVVILAYDGAKIHNIDTPQGSVGAHRLFIHLLQAILSDG